MGLGLAGERGGVEVTAGDVVDALLADLQHRGQFGGGPAAVEEAARGALTTEPRAAPPACSPGSSRSSAAAHSELVQADRADQQLLEHRPLPDLGTAIQHPQRTQPRDQVI